MKSAHSIASVSCRLILSTLLAGVTLLFSLPRAEARDEVLIRAWRAPFNYTLELEPHLVAGTNPPGAGQGSGAGIGARASVMVLPEGFLPRINDSVSVGFGLDYGRYAGTWAVQGHRDYCVHFEPGPNGTSICTEVSGGTYNYVYIPVVMQWNFWLTRRWSAFGEPGLDIYHVGRHGFGFGPAIYVGGRFHIRDWISVTLRLGYPTFSLGASFFL